MKLSSVNRTHHQSEEGLSLVELLVAITVLAVVVLFSSTVFINGFRTSTTMENRSKALQIANEVIAIAKQSPYRQLYTPHQASNAGLFNTTSSPFSDKCDVDRRTSTTDPAKFGGAIVKQPTDYNLTPAWDQYREFKGLVYCQERYFGQEESEQVGTTFYVQTDIIRAVLGSADIPSRAEAGGTPAAENIKGKKVVVTVRWKDVHSGPDEVNKVVLQQTILPQSWDCPLGYTTNPTTNTASGSAVTNGIIGC